MPREIIDALRELSLAFPEAEEMVSHGMVNFRVRGGKVFVMYAVNHHGDGRVALWLPAPEGAQRLHVREEPQHYFVPPYVGVRGWLGVRLDQGISWPRVASLVRIAYEKVAPRRLLDDIGPMPTVRPPTARANLDKLDPIRTVAAQRRLVSLRKICLALPETAEIEQFGRPTWRAGKKSFASFHADDARLCALFWVGVERQGWLTADPRYRIPPYFGHNGWIQLDITETAVLAEIRALALDSYRHFALKRMLGALGAAPGTALAT